MEPTITINGLAVPAFLYGTAWKEAATTELTEMAIAQGFRGIDTANQRKHYDEAAVGHAIAAAIAGGRVTRDELYLQTKYTFQRDQDHRLPYNPSSSIATQVEESFASSLQHLGVERIDSYLLHGPSRATGLGAEDWEAWRAMEKVHASGRASLLGASNVTLEQLETLCKEAKVKPHFVQNRCFAASGWDRTVRTFCKANGIIYQGFSLLTANRGVMGNPQLATMAEHHNCSVAQIIFRYAIDVGMLPLTGTTDAGHMSDDLSVFELRLEPKEVELVDCIAG